ncbi:hypothetical protein [Bordetella tumbae]|uniref:hypothetical protein n=1 Tax=Bordetella tumbae TaxID=1649139 RepID=UPI0039EFADF8
MPGESERRASREVDKQAEGAAWGHFLSLLVLAAFAALDCLYGGVPAACLGVAPGLSHGLGP